MFLPLTVGGAVRSVDDVRQLLLAGADKAGINTAAVADPELVRRAADAFGSQGIVVAVDARRDPQAPAGAPRWVVYTHAGASRRTWMPWPGACAWRSWARGSCC